MGDGQDHRKYDARVPLPHGHQGARGVLAPRPVRPLGRPVRVLQRLHQRRLRHAAGARGLSVGGSVLLLRVFILLLLLLLLFMTFSDENSVIRINWIISTVRTAVPCTTAVTAQS